MEDPDRHGSGSIQGRGRPQVDCRPTSWAPRVLHLPFPGMQPLTSSDLQAIRPARFRTTAGLGKTDSANAGCNPESKRSLNVNVHFQKTRSARSSHAGGVAAVVQLLERAKVSIPRFVASTTSGASARRVRALRFPTLALQDDGVRPRRASTSSSADLKCGLRRHARRRAKRQALRHQRRGTVRPLST
jgi:hypothetical protein